MLEEAIAGRLDFGFGTCRFDARLSHLQPVWLFRSDLLDISPRLGLCWETANIRGAVSGIGKKTQWNKASHSSIMQELGNCTLSAVQYYSTVGKAPSPSQTVMGLKPSQLCLLLALLPSGVTMSNCLIPLRLFPHPYNGASNKESCISLICIYLFIIYYYNIIL